MCQMPWKNKQFDKSPMWSSEPLWWVRIELPEVLWVQEEAEGDTAGIPKLKNMIYLVVRFLNKGLIIIMISLN